MCIKKQAKASSAGNRRCALLVGRWFIRILLTFIKIWKIALLPVRLSEAEGMG